MRHALLFVAACGSSSSPMNEASPDAAPPKSVDGNQTSALAPVIPTPTGTCPALKAGDVTFAPAGMAPRKVKLDFAAGGGPLVFYWHATGSDPVEAAYALGDTEGAITGAGGVVAAPYADSSAGTFEWFVVNGSDKPDDFLLADEVVACLAQAHLIDTAHIHSMGMSAGALQTTAFSFSRAAYLASVATYSGGMPPQFAPTNEQPANKFAALIFDGGTSDDVFGVDFKAASETYKSTLIADGHFAALCDHGKGHDIPLDAAPSVAAFFAANGFGVSPSPYAAGLPASFPSYCSL